MDKIIYKPACFLGIEESIEVEIGQRQGVTREGNCVDVALSRSLGHGCPLQLVVLLRTNGTLDEWFADWDLGRAANTYWHFHSSCLESVRDEVTGKYGPSEFPDRKPTQAQIATIAKMFFGKIKPFGVSGSTGRPVSAWAFAGLSMQQVEALGNEGKRGFYTGPTPDTPDDCRIEREESALEQAYEDGKIPGAMPPD